MTKEIVVQEQNEIALNGPSAVEFEASLVEAQQKATAMKRMISAHDWSVNIGGNEHIKNEAWVTLAGAYGCTASIVSTERIPGYKQAFVATAEVLRQTPNGVVSIGRADAECGTDGDGRWESKQPAFAVRSMAQTRAISKAIASVFRWVVVLAGYHGTPAEEMDNVNKFDNNPRQEIITSSNNKPSDRQVDYLYSLGYGDEEGLARELNKKKVSELIDNLLTNKDNQSKPAARSAPAVKKVTSFSQLKRQVNEFRTEKGLSIEKLEYAIGAPIEEYFKEGNTFDDMVTAVEANNEQD